MQHHVIGIIGIFYILHKEALSMYIKKRSGPKTEPCGTPEITVVDSDPLTTTC